MQQRAFNYSLKNIPIPSEKLYKTRLIEKVEDVIKRMRWKAIYFEKDNCRNQTIQNKFGLKSKKCPPQIKDMENFENDLVEMARNIKFRKVNNEFQKTINKDIKSVRNSKNAFIPADKTRNMYEMDKNTYDKLLHENITKSYKKTSDDTYNEINREAKQIATKLGIQDRATSLAKKQAFITLKDHKENFENAPKCRLINPAKSILGRVSKQLLERINNAARLKTKVQQWKNTSSVIDWFNNLGNKHSCTFVQFDIVDFYPSITEELLTNAINHAKQLTAISADDLEVIMHARKSLLFDQETTWVKKDTETTFDVTMGSFDGAEVCELVGLYILSILSEKYEDSQIGLYRDDGLAAVHNLNSQASDRMRKDIIQVFKELGLKITIQVNLKEVNFLDVSFDLRTGTYKPYKKPNDSPLYINTSSNHPPNIIKQLPQNIGKRISDISSNKEIFDEAATFYNDALKASGYKEKIEYKPTTNTENCTANRKRNIIWFNPPYNMNVQTNVAKQFLQLIDKYFPKEHKLHKIFNRNNVKVSYSCLPNVSSIIRTHNNKVIRDKTEIGIQKCNCRAKESCPLQGGCMTKNVIYKAQVTNTKNNESKSYIGLTERTFKDRLYKHRNSLRYRTKANNTELSKYVWNLKDKNINDANIQWSILDRAPAFRNGGKRCELCLIEKYHIIFQDIELLNKRSELLSNCRHINKFLLSNFKETPPDN